MEGTSVHRLASALDKSVHSGGHYMVLFIPGVLHIMAFIGRLRAIGVPFLGFRYKRVEISLAEVHERVGKFLISVSEKAQKD